MEAGHSGRTAEEGYHQAMEDIKDSVNELIYYREHFLTV